MWTIDLSADVADFTDEPPPPLLCRLAFLRLLMRPWPFPLELTLLPLVKVPLLPAAAPELLDLDRMRGVVVLAVDDIKLSINLLPKLVYFVLMILVNLLFSSDESAELLNAGWFGGGKRPGGFSCCV